LPLLGHGVYGDPFTPALIDRQGSITRTFAPLDLSKPTSWVSRLFGGIGNTMVNYNLKVSEKGAYGTDHFPSSGTNYTSNQNYCHMEMIHNETTLYRMVSRTGLVVETSSIEKNMQTLTPPNENATIRKFKKHKHISIPANFLPDCEQRYRRKTQRSNYL